MPNARVDFHMEPLEKVPADLKSKFLSVADVASWKLVDESGQVLYSGLIVSGPKALPGGGFQCVADITLDIPKDPAMGIPVSAIPAIQNAVMTEFQKRALIIKHPLPGTLQ